MLITRQVYNKEYRLSINSQIFKLKKLNFKSLNLHFAAKWSFKSTIYSLFHKSAYSELIMCFYPFYLFFRKHNSPGNRDNDYLKKSVMHPVAFHLTGVVVDNCRYLRTAGYRISGLLFVGTWLSKPLMLSVNHSII